MLIDEIIKERFGVHIRFVEEYDAEFILGLRTDPKLSRFLSRTVPDVETQKKWIKRYKNRENAEEEFYFIFYKQDGAKYGLSRIYDINENSFVVGSWLFSEESPVGLAVLGDLCARDYAFDRLDSEYCLFDVRKQNTNVVNYHERFHPDLIDEDELNYYFRLDKEKYVHYRNQLLKIYGYDVKRILRKI